MVESATARRRICCKCWSGMGRSIPGESNRSELIQVDPLHRQIPGRVGPHSRGAPALEEQQPVMP
eukprot:12938302-Prorocentrum_lima.AAC.1